MMRGEAVGNVNLRYGSSCPVNEFPPSAAGFYDVHGNVWEWVRAPRFHNPPVLFTALPCSAPCCRVVSTSSQWWAVSARQVEDHFAPLPNFEIHYLYDDFSTPCFDGWHTTIIGGSWVSTGDLASNFARYAFRRHFFQHLGFRCVPCSAACLCGVRGRRAHRWCVCACPQVRGGGRT
jgi:formylglycine-generating enzyme required for sulfatase activity